MIVFIQKIIRLFCAVCVIGIFAAIIIAFYVAAREIQPALFWINILAPKPGDRYSNELVIGLTMLTFMVPLCALLAVLIGILSLLDRLKGHY